MTPIIDRIRKLLALAQSDNVNESAAAAGAAQRLMTEHQISMDAVEKEVVEQVTQDAEPLEENVRQIWKRRLAHVLCGCNGCGSVITGDRSFGKNGKLMIYGRKSRVDTVRYLYAWLVREVERLAQAHNRGGGITWLNSFRSGCVDTVVEKIRAATADTMKGYLLGASESARSSALVVVERDRAAIEAFKRKMGYVATSSAQRTDMNARAEGQRAARSINFGSGPGLGGGPRRLG